MQINSILDIIGGKLLNNPSISFIYSFKTKVSKVKEGDLFIAQNLDDVQEAVKKGAFAIITEGFYPIIDKEIAWIKVDNLKTCLIKLIRYKLAHFTLDAFLTHSISYDLFSSSTNDNVKFIDNNLYEFIDEIENIANGNILIAKDKDILNKVYPNNREFVNENFEISNIIQHSIFEVSFCFENEYFHKLKIPTIYLNEFLNIYTFFNKNNLDSSKLKAIQYFKPIFLDKSINMVDFGKSDKFIIVQDSLELIYKEIEYIKESFTYAKLLFITSTHIKDLPEKQIRINEISELKDILKKESFNGVYIIGYKTEDITSSFIKLEKELSLF